MPLALSHLVADRKAVVVPFAGVGELRVEYYPRRVTGSMLVNFAAADPAALQGATAERAVAVVAGATDALVKLLASWDLLGDDGAPLPIDRETVDGLGILVEWTILGAILSDGNLATVGEAAAPGGDGPSPNGATSGAGSSPTDSSARSRTGTGS